ncbi:MAG: Asp-tRNA(Asn)/Glu-tRNA(Gln) amidotransferase subunit GatC [Alphaproteobacteria bacterium]|nr:Asp-tRNA(Asn)/Glu-tRNA(Gln) amidotransferase subunit GatC [Alphaproteobacteria bacterium]
MAFTKQELAKFTNQIRIEIPDEKLEAMHVDQVWEWMNQMKKTDTTGVEPMFTPAQHAAPLRDDVVTVGNVRDALLANTPDKSGNARGYFAVPKIIDE